MSTSARDFVRILPNPLQLLARGIRLRRLRGQFRIKSLSALLVSALFRGECCAIQSSESPRLNLERSLKLLPRFFCSAEFQQQTSELFPDRDERAGRGRVLAEHVFRVGGAAQHFECVIFLAFSM